MYGNKAKILRIAEGQDGNGQAESGTSGSAESGVGTSSETERGEEGVGIAKLQCSPEEFKEAIEAELDKVFRDLHTAARAVVHKAVIVPLRRRERRSQRRQHKS